MTDFLDEKRQEINDRLAELKPLVDEYSRLQAAAAALEGVGGGAAAPAAARAAAPAAARTRRGPGRPRRSTSAPARTASGAPRRRAGRRKGSGTRSLQALSFVQEQPGITIPELAARMGIKQNYLYRVLPSLEQENKVEKKGRGWHAKA